MTTGATGPAARESVEVLRRLWPEGGRTSRRPRRSSAWLLLPSARSPRLLVPADARTAHVMLRRTARGRRQRWTQEGLAAAQRLGLLSRCPVERWVVEPDGLGIDDFVRTRVPGARAVGVLLGPPRPNAKPVLQVFDDVGRTVAFGKVGVDDLTARLIRNEARVLRGLAERDLRHLTLPEVVALETWQGLEVLLMTALPSSQRRASPVDIPWEATYELAEEPGLAWSPLQDSDYLGSLRERAEALPTSALGRDVLAAVLEQAQATWGERVLAFGRWHGDWAPWNMGVAGQRLDVWDWERSEVGVPAGFDALHFALQVLFRAQSDPAEAGQRLLQTARQGLARWYDDDRPRATLLLYLVEVLLRYAGDSEPAPTPGIRARSRTIQAMMGTLMPGHAGTM